MCCGMVVAVLKLTCRWLLGTGDIRVLQSQQGCLCRRRQLLTKWPMLFPTLAWWFTWPCSLTLIFFPALSCLDLVLYLLLYLSRLRLILEKGGWRPRVWKLFHCLRPYLLHLLLLLLPPFLPQLFLISALPPYHHSLLPFHCSTFLHPFVGGWHERKHH